MNIQILDSWLREHLETNAKPADIARCMSLCGPSFEKTEKVTVNGKTDYLYDIEVTTNRVDSMCVMGIAREALVILPEFGFKAKLKNVDYYKGSGSSDKYKIEINDAHDLTHRIMAVVLEVEELGTSPKWMQERITHSGMRPLNAAVDITNYVMLETGHPSHVFDYDLVQPKMSFREAKKGEKIVSLDNKEYTLSGGDIVITDSSGKIIDLPGIIGTKNSVVNKSTKRILFFLDNNNAIKIRKSSMTTGIRTMAATLNEKGVDPELSKLALERGVELMQKILNAKVSSKIYDIYPKAYKPKTVKVEHDFIESRLGIEIKDSQINRILTSLGMIIKKADKNTYVATIPSFRSNDISIPEDIVEEIARIYGYHNIPSILMTGSIPDPLPDSTFGFEYKIKTILKGLTAHEVMTYSMVAKDQTERGSLKIKNPLGADGAYMRISLMPSLIAAARSNESSKNYHLFEMANVYIPKKNDLPDEILTLSGIFSKDTSYRDAKGIVEFLLNELGIKWEEKPGNSRKYRANHHLNIFSHKTKIGDFGVTKDGWIYYEFGINELYKVHSDVKKYKAISKYPPQIEDVTMSIPEDVVIGDVIREIKRSDKLIFDAYLHDLYENPEGTFYTIRVSYQNKEKTLTNDEVRDIREKMLDNLKSKFTVRTRD